MPNDLKKLIFYQTKHLLVILKCEHLQPFSIFDIIVKGLLLGSGILIEIKLKVLENCTNL